MASKQDLLEAHGYNRRRLVSAFVSGAPQGRDVESVKRGRPVVAGIAASVLLLGGSAIAGALSTPPESGWKNAHVVIGKQSAARFVSADGTLYPVLNATSARLMLPASAGFPVVVLDDDVIAATPHGPARGILGAPDDLPAPANLLQSRWVSCLVDQHTRTTLTTRDLPGADPEAGPTALFASAGGARWLVVGGARFLIPAEQIEKTLLVDLGRGRTTSQPVPGTWLDLLAQGPALSLNVPRRGDPLTGPMSMSGKVDRIGRVIGAPDGTGHTIEYLVLADGLVPLTPFAAEVYRAQEPELGQPRSLPQSDVTAVPTSPQATLVFPDAWPVAVPTITPGVPCAVLDTPAANDRAASTRLLVLSPDSPFAAAPGASSVVTVDPGHGALARVSSTGAPTGPVYVVDQSGQKFAVTDPSDETLARLGYAGTTPRIVPAPWILLFPSGPALNEAAALASPTAVGAGGP